jgi:hypothetical protein
MSESAAEKDAGWQPGRWWRVTEPDGSVWCETSNEDEAREAARPGDRLYRLFTLSQEKWVPQPFTPLASTEEQADE